jgi:hypothetical protein
LEFRIVPHVYSMIMYTSRWSRILYSNMMAMSWRVDINEAKITNLLSFNYGSSL